jgi:hypothetical protein
MLFKELHYLVYSCINHLKLLTFFNGKPILSILNILFSKLLKKYLNLSHNIDIIKTFSQNIIHFIHCFLFFTINNISINHC